MILFQKKEIMKYTSLESFKLKNSKSTIKKDDIVVIEEINLDDVYFTFSDNNSVMMMNKKDFFKKFSSTSKLNQEQTCVKLNSEFLSSIINTFLNSDTEITTEYLEYSSYKRHNVMLNDHKVNGLKIKVANKTVLTTFDENIKTDEILPLLHKKIRNSKSFTKKLNNQLSKELNPYNILKVLKMIGNPYVLFVHASSGSIQFRREQSIVRVVKPKDVPNMDKRALKGINCELKQLYKRIEVLNNKKNNLIKSKKDKLSIIC